MHTTISKRERRIVENYATTMDRKLSRPAQLKQVIADARSYGLSKPALCWLSTVVASVYAGNTLAHAFENANHWLAYDFDKVFDELQASRA